MLSQKTIKISLFIFLLQGFVLVNFAQAYIDPGTGSFIFQLLIAGLLGSLFFIKTIIRNIKNYFMPKDVSKENAELSLDKKDDNK
jgi:hypothetical protein